MEKYKEGTVFELYEDDNQQYIVLKNMELNGKIYVVVSPVSGGKDNLKIDSKKLMVLNVNKDTDDVEFIDDDVVLKSVVEKLF